MYLENNIFNFPPEQRGETHRDQQCEQHSAVGKRVWQSSALVRPTISLCRDVAPIDDDIEPIGESRADVEMGNDEDEEPLEAEVPRARMNPKNPNKNMKIQDMLFTGIGVRLVSEAEVLVDNIELNC